MTSPLRILFVGNFGRKNNYHSYYNVDNKLANGFIRNGHNVVCFSDRDHAREASVFRSQKFGKRKMAKKLLYTAEQYQPHLVLFGHCDLFTNNFFLRLRELLPSTKLATFCVDAVFREKTMASFRMRAINCDAAFITTADKEQLLSLDIPIDRLHFMPNPVDASIETARVFEMPLSQFSWDGQFLGTGISKRDEQLDFLVQHLGASYRFRTGGRAFSSSRVEGTKFINQLTDAPVSPNLPLDDTTPRLMPYLYSSDRIAQLLGQGVTTLVPKESRLSEIYEDGVIEYENRNDLIEKMTALKFDDTRRRKIGEIGYRLAHDRTNTKSVAKLITSICMQTNEHENFWLIR